METLVFNTALIRRRIRTPKLSMEILTTGKLSKTDIVLCYLDDRVDRELLSLVKNRIQQLKVEALTMNQESPGGSAIFRGRWFNPFPKFKYTERPDAAAAGILEGKLVILVDNSPSAMILPASVFDIMEEADDFYFPPVTGTYLKAHAVFHRADDDFPDAGLAASHAKSGVDSKRLSVLPGCLRRSTFRSFSNC